MPDLDLRNHLLLHTNARLGMINSQQVIDVVSLHNLEGDVTVTPVLTGVIVVDPNLEGSASICPLP